MFSLTSNSKTNLPIINGNLKGNSSDSNPVAKGFSLGSKMGEKMESLSRRSLKRTLCKQELQ